MQNVRKEIPGQLILAFALLAFGCKPENQDLSQPVEQLPAGNADVTYETPPLDPTWEAAIEAVRSGESIEIRLRETPVTDAQLGDLSGLVALRRINLPKSQITDAGLEVIAAQIPDLELLRLGSPQLSDSGISSIAKLKKLKFLHLIDVPITDAGLAHLHPMTWLESFYLDGGQVTDSGLTDLIKALPELHFHRDQQHLPGDPRRDGH